MDMIDADVVPKGRFAEIINVSPGRVSQYISEGKLFGPALVGEGRAAKIRVSVARAQLQRRLDIAQRMTNGAATLLDGPSPSTSPPPEALGEAPPVAVPQVEIPRNTLDEQYKAERLAKIQAENRRIKRDELADRGVYTRSDDARDATKRAVGAVVTGVEGGLTQIAQAIAAKFEVPQRDVIHLLKQEWRGIRASIDEQLRRAAAEMPETIDDASVDEDEAADTSAAA